MPDYILLALRKGIEGRYNLPHPTATYSSATKAGDVGNDDDEALKRLPDGEYALFRGKINEPSEYDEEAVQAQRAPDPKDTKPPGPFVFVREVKLKTPQMPARVTELTAPASE